MLSCLFHKKLRSRVHKLVQQKGEKTENPKLENLPKTETKKYKHQSP